MNQVKVSKLLIKLSLI